MIAMRGGVLELWDLVKLREIKQLKNKFDIKNIISFSPDGRTFAVYSAGQIHLYDSKSGTESSLISAAQFPANADLRLLQNQTFLVIPSSVTTPSANTDTKLQYPIIWDPNKNKVTTPLPEAASIFAISRNSLNMITSSGTDYARLWRLDQRIIDQKDMFDKILLGFNAHIAALQSDDGAIAVQDMQLGTKVVRLNGSNSLHLTALTKNGALLAAVNGKTQLELYFGDKIIYSKDFSQNIDSVQFSPDDRILLVQYGVSSWRMIKIAEHYDITDDAKPSVEEPHPTKTVSSAVSLAEFSPDSKVLLLIKSGTIYLIRCDDNLLIASFPVKGDMPARYAFSPDTSKLVLFDGKQIQTIDWQNGKRATVDGSDANAPQFLVFQPGGKQFLAILPDKSQLWNFNNSTPPKDFPTLPNSSAAYFIPESTETTNHHFGYMLTLDSENRTLQIWDVGSGDKKGPDFKLASPIYGRLQFIPNTQQIIVPSHSGWIYKLKITSEGLIPGDSQIRVGMPTSPVNGILVTRQIFVSVVSFGLGQRISMTDFSNNPNVSEISKLDELKDKGSALAKAFLVDEGRYTIH
jgi:WD40 repeat protein